MESGSLSLAPLLDLPPRKSKLTWAMLMALTLHLLVAGVIISYKPAPSQALKLDLDLWLVDSPMGLATDLKPGMGSETEPATESKPAAESKPIAESEPATKSKPIAESKPATDISSPKPEIIPAIVPTSQAKPGSDSAPHNTPLTQAISVSKAEPVTKIKPEPRTAALAKKSPTVTKLPSPDSAQASTQTLMPASGVSTPPNSGSPHKNSAASLTQTSAPTKLGIQGSRANPLPFGGKHGPTFSYQVMPEYPIQARRQKLSGQVRLQILISSEGKVEEVQVESSTATIFTEAAIVAVSKSKFKPLSLNGVNVSCWTVLPISFQLN